jgi:hypothetical protein
MFHRSGFDRCGPYLSGGFQEEGAIIHDDRDGLYIGATYGTAIERTIADIRRLVSNPYVFERIAIVQCMCAD